MKGSHCILFAGLAIVLLAVAGCASGGDGSSNDTSGTTTTDSTSGDSTPGSGDTSSTDGNPSTAVSTSTLPVGDSNCPNGGISVETGIDENGNGVLDSGEVDQTGIIHLLQGRDR